MTGNHQHASDRHAHDRRHTHDRQYEPPHDCPVCGDTLIVTRLGCDSCGTEVSGRFAGSAFAALDPRDRAILTVFLTSRGNMREVAKWLDVSYPTARQRFSDFLGRLGLSVTDPTVDSPTTERATDSASNGAAHDDPETRHPESQHHKSQHHKSQHHESQHHESRVEREEILRRLATGEIDLAEATTQLGRL